MRSLRARLAIAVLAAAATAGRGEGRAGATDWTSFGGGGTSSRATAEAVGARFAPLWTSPPPIAAAHPEPIYTAVLASPAVGDGFVAVATYGNKVRVMREQDGAPVWDASWAMPRSPLR